MENSSRKDGLCFEDLACRLSLPLRFSPRLPPFALITHSGDFLNWLQKPPSIVVPSALGAREAKLPNKLAFLHSLQLGGPANATNEEKVIAFPKCGIALC